MNLRLQRSKLKCKTLPLSLGLFTAHYEEVSRGRDEDHEALPGGEHEDHEKVRVGFRSHFYRARNNGLYVVWWLLFLLLLTSSAQHACSILPTMYKPLFRALYVVCSLPKLFGWSPFHGLLMVWFHIEVGIHRCHLQRESYRWWWYWCSVHRGRQRFGWHLCRGMFLCHLRRCIPNSMWDHTLGSLWNKFHPKRWLQANLSAMYVTFWIVIILVSMNRLMFCSYLSIGCGDLDEDCSDTMAPIWDENVRWD